MTMVVSRLLPDRGRRWPGEAGTDEGTAGFPHPSSLRSDTFPRSREKGEALP